MSKCSEIIKLLESSGTRICTRCNKEYPDTDFIVTSKKDKRFLTSICKKCRYQFHNLHPSKDSGSQSNSQISDKTDNSKESHQGELGFDNFIKKVIDKLRKVSSGNVYYKDKLVGEILRNN